MKKIKIPSEKGCSWLGINRSKLLEKIERNKQKEQELWEREYDIRRKRKTMNINKWISNENKGEE